MGESRVAGDGFHRKSSCPPPLFFFCARRRQIEGISSENVSEPYPFLGLCNSGALTRWVPGGRTGRVSVVTACLGVRWTSGQQCVLAASSPATGRF